MAKRLLGLLGVVAFLIAAIGLDGPPPARAAASTATLFGITRSQFLVKVDPASGLLTRIANLFPNCSSNCPVDSQSSSLASDPTNHRLFAIRTNSFSFFFQDFTQELLTIDSQTGAVLSNPQFSVNAPSALAFDTSTHTLFGLGRSGIVKVDPVTAAVTPFATVGVGFGGSINQIALSSASHTIYESQESVFLPQPPKPTEIFAVDTVTGQVSPGVAVDTPVRWIATDGATLLGLTDLPFGQSQPVRISPTTGTTTLIGGLPSMNGSFIPTGPSVDPSSHTLFVDVFGFDGASIQDTMFSINDQTGVSMSTLIRSFDNLTSIVVEAPPPITPESIKVDVQNALASGAIDNAGIAQSLLAKLDAAASARADAGASGARTNACVTAANIYQAFIAEVTALSAVTASGVRPHVAAASANQLISEAQFLIANCP